MKYNFASEIPGIQSIQLKNQFIDFIIRIFYALNYTDRKQILFFDKSGIIFIMV
jgi:hypothetical protein